VQRPLIILLAREQGILFRPSSLVASMRLFLCFFSGFTFRPRARGSNVKNEKQPRNKRVSPARLVEAIFSAMAENVSHARLGLTE
jgi:hypothetical protein